MSQTAGSRDIPWWKKTVVYQIYPRSYFDSNADGIGDLPGIIEKLDYIKDLGIETIWFSPFFSSPQMDFGYDISDYCAIAPEYGRMEDVERLIKEIHARDMYVVFDMVMNHTSDQHPWFIESRSSRDNPKRDWYVWKDGRKPKGKAPPNNWRSMIGGPGWHYDKQTDQWYWAQFLPFQPDLNYRNPEVKAAMFDAVRFWLKKGVDGFRLDIINTIFEDPEFRNNPFSWTLIPSDDNPAALFQNPKYTRDHPDTFQFVQDLRAVIDEFNDPPRFLVGEVSAPIDTLVKYCGVNADGLNLVFLFQTLGTPLKAEAFRMLLEKFEKHFKDPLLPTWVFSNHDRMRRITRLADNAEKAKLNATLQLTARGVPFVYYGEEIGMPQHYLPVKKSLDPVALKYKWVPQFLFKAARRVIKESINRDECRTPMQWDSTPNAGFCPPDVTPWLPVTDNHEEINVVVEKNDPDSLYQMYRRLLALRKESEPLSAGSFEFLEVSQSPKSLLAYERVYGEKKAYVYLNCGKNAITFKHASGPVDLLFSTSIVTEPLKGEMLHLKPWEGVIIRPRS